ncbi:MAG: enoyl-CoA hydratase/isomerase family protein [Pseudomonadota bacterium]|jgi:enoyl-CoA hydratase
MPKAVLMETIQYEERGEIGIVTFARPDVLNSINVQMAEELLELLDRLEEQVSPRIVVLTGSERAFCAGADLKRVQQDRASGGAGRTQQTRLLERIRTLLRKFESTPKIIVAAISGVAYGGGCEIALACDMRVASQNARIALPEVRLGVLPAAGGTQRLARIVGLGRAKQLLLGGEPVNADTALQWGLANAVFPDEGFLDATLEFLRPVLKGAPLSQAALKMSALASTHVDLETGLDIEGLWAAFLKTTEDSREGVAAFNEKRKPTFKGS